MSTELRRAVARGCILIGCFLFAAVIVMASRHGHSPFLVVATCALAGALFVSGRSYLTRTRRTS